MRWSSFIISMKISKISIFVNASLSMCLWLTHLILLFMSSFSFKTFKIHRQLPKCHKISSTFSRQILISSLVFILKGAEASAIDFLHMKLRPANCLSRGAYFSKKISILMVAFLEKLNYAAVLQKCIIYIKCKVMEKKASIHSF